MTSSSNQSNENQPHIHGGSPHHALKRLGLSQIKVIDFSVNVSPLGPPHVLYQNWNRLFGTVESYPTVDGDGIADYYLQRFGLQRDNILPGNGSTECIYLVPRVLGFKKVGIITPSFHDYERSCLLAGAELVEIPLSEKDQFKEPDIEILQTAIKAVDALMLGNPNNPTGTLFSTDRILDLAEQNPQKWILVDEAFLQFLDDFPERTLTAPQRLRKNILVFHSLTKLYDLPGIRLGSVIGHQETILHLKKFKEPWTVNGIAEKIAQLLIDSGDYEHQLKTLVKQEQQRFINSLGKLKGIALYPSPVNFMLARWLASDNLDDLIKFLLSNGIHIRDCRNFRQLENNFFRFAILKPADNNQLIDLIIQATSQFQDER